MVSVNDNKIKMQITDNITTLRESINLWRKQGLKIAFVPTMGNLHQGHIALVDKAKTIADKVVASIFINPMQFGANEDIDSYPRTLLDDQEKLIASGCDLLFTPTASTIYPKGLENQTFVEVPDISDGYCGESRPGHFRGVATVVCKLFNIVQPDLACFGLKDYQQVQVIETMVDDLSMPIEIVALPTVREPSGLALSSRNNYLTAQEKLIAPTLYQNIQWLANAIKDNKDFMALTKQAAKQINQAGLKTDYIHVCHAKTLQAATANDKELVILAAAFCGKARLIDNILVSLSH